MNYANSFVEFLQIISKALYKVKYYWGYMHRLNLIAIIGILAAVSLVVGMASPLAFAQDNMTMTMDDNMSSIGNLTNGGNATSMAETESLPSAGETGVCQPCCGTNTPDHVPMC